MYESLNNMWIERLKWSKTDTLVLIIINNYVCVKLSNIKFITYLI